ncbi:MAG: hypothetical protein Q9198_000836 [Flavoplaca austrocitrina]
MTTHGWPKPLELADKALDTAVLLVRDYQLEVQYRLNCSANVQDLCVPIDVFTSFSSKTKSVIDQLCDRSKIRRVAVDLMPNLQPKVETINQAWPEAPELHGRMLDTALLLSSYHAQRIRYCIQHSHNKIVDRGIPVDVWHPFSKNIELIIKALCQHGSIPLNPLGLIPKLKAAPGLTREAQEYPDQFSRTAGQTSSLGHAMAKIEDQVHAQLNDFSDGRSNVGVTKGNAMPKRLRAMTEKFLRIEVPRNLAAKQKDSTVQNSQDDSKHADPHEKVEDVASDVRVEDSASSVANPADEPIAPSPLHTNRHQTSATSATRSPKRAARRKRQVTITIRDAEARSKLETLERSCILGLIQESIQQQGLHVQVVTCERYAGRRANFWLRAKSSEGARILRKEWDVGMVKAFGRGAYMRESDGFVGMS